MSASGPTRPNSPAGAPAVQTDMVACRLGFARRPSQLPNDDSSDDNRDDSGPVNNAPYKPKIHLSPLVRAIARSWQYEGSGFVFIRSASAMGFGLRALNRRNWSSSSSLTSTNVSHLTSRPPEKRKVGGSIPPLATKVDSHRPGDGTLVPDSYASIVSATASWLLSGDDRDAATNRHEIRPSRQGCSLEAPPRTENQGSVAATQLKIGGHGHSELHGRIADSSIADSGRRHHRNDAPHPSALHGQDDQRAADNSTALDILRPRRRGLAAHKHVRG